MLHACPDIRGEVQPEGCPARPRAMNAKLAALVSVVLVLAACAPATSPGGVATPAGHIVLARAEVARASSNPDDALRAGAALDGFGIDLYRAVAAGQTNAVFSPASITLALAMARAGARGKTAAEMDAVMHAVASGDHAGWLNALDQALAARTGTFKDESGADLQVTLRIANAPFAQQGMPLEQAYLAALAERYGAGLRLVDYATQTEKARTLINGWVDAQTEHRIPELLTPGVLTPATRLALVNAVYLKAAWQAPFPAGATTAGPFTRVDGSTVQVPFMAQTASLAYASGDGWRAVEIPYVGGSLAMTVILPDDMAAFERTFSGDVFAAIAGGLTAGQVALSFPKFGIETRTELAPILATLGMPSAFDDRADFSGITSAERLAISNVVHQANIDVDEKGTEAAAATAVVMRETAIAAEPIAFRADRPFLFALRDVPTGSILFLGRVGDPSIDR